MNDHLRMIKEKYVLLFIFTSFWPPWLYALGVFYGLCLTNCVIVLHYLQEDKMKKIKVTHKNGEFVGYLIEDRPEKIVFTNEKGNIEFHYPKDKCTYIILEEK